MLVPKNSHASTHNSQLLLLRARAIVPIRQPPIRDGAVLITRNRVAAVGPWRELAKAVCAKTIELGDLILLPADDSDIFYGLSDFGSSRVWDETYRYSGMHRDNGTLVAAGPHVRSGGSAPKPGMTCSTAAWSSKPPKKSRASYACAISVA